MLLDWSGKYGRRDGFDETGTRVASVALCRDPVIGSPGRYHKPSYWTAFACRPAIDDVLVDGEPGRWATEAEAKAAAEAAYATWRAETRARGVVPRVVVVEPKPHGSARTVLMGVRLVTRGWISFVAGRASTIRHRRRELDASSSDSARRDEH